MTKLVSIGLLLVGSATAILAMQAAPEIDPGSASGALIFLAGAVLVVRGRRKA